MLKYFLFVILIYISYSNLCIVDPHQNSTLQWIVQKNITSNYFPIAIFQRNYTQILNFTSSWTYGSIILLPTLELGYKVYWLASANQSFVGDMEIVISSQTENCSLTKTVSFYKPQLVLQDLVSFSFVYQYIFGTSQTQIETKWTKQGTTGEALIKVSANWGGTFQCEFQYIYTLERWDDILQVFPMNFDQWETWDYLQSTRFEPNCFRKGYFATLKSQFLSGEEKDLSYYYKDDNCEITNTISSYKSVIENFIKTLGGNICKLFGYNDPRVCFISADLGREFPIAEKCPKPYEEEMKAFVGVFATGLIILSCCSCLCFFLCILICRKKLFFPKEQRKVVTHYQDDEEIEIELYNQSQ